MEKEDSVLVKNIGGAQDCDYMEEGKLMLVE